MFSDFKKNIIRFFIIALFPAISLCWYSFCQRNNDKDGEKFIIFSLLGFSAIPTFVALSVFFEGNEFLLLSLMISCAIISLAQLTLIEKKVSQYHNNPTWINYIK